MTVERLAKRTAIPARRQALCSFGCGTIVDTEAPGTYQMIVAGWVKNRSAGGTNAVTLMERSPSWACRVCIDKQNAGVSIDQMELFRDG